MILSFISNFPHTPLQTIQIFNTGFTSIQSIHSMDLHHKKEKVVEIITIRLLLFIQLVVVALVWPAGMPLGLTHFEHQIDV